MFGIVLTGLALVLSSPAYAWAQGRLEVVPVRLEITDRVAALTVRNLGEHPMTLQVEIVAWTQTESSDQFSATQELLATPPIFTVGPGDAQVVRVGLRGPPPAAQERAYRLYLTELPLASATDSQVRVLMRLGIPVFVPPRRPGGPRLVWEGQESAPGRVRLTVRNEGDVHARLLRVRVRRGGGPVVESPGGYVLAGSVRSWDVDLPGTGRTLELSLATDEGERELLLDLR